MADQSFETRLSRLFADTPPFPDEPAFVARVEQRLDQGWGVRRLAIGVAGLVGGCITVAQLVGSNLVGRIDAVSRSSLHEARAGAGLMLDRAADLTPALKALPLGGETLWLIAGMAVLAAALFATRILEDI